ncbi:MAG: hypothetical protein IJA86_02420 [Clostridia bacterium]|nr:hypothetical protein [Clostridia bacterium]
MKKTIAYKKQSIGILYIILTVFGAIFSISAITEKDMPLILIGALLLIISMVLSIQFLLLPSDIIILSDDDTLILPRGVTVPLDCVSEVSFKRASAKGLRYRWGSITIFTYSDTYKFGFVADCENVAIQLNKLIRKVQKRQD